MKRRLGIAAAALGALGCVLYCSGRSLESRSNSTAPASASSPRSSSDVDALRARLLTDDRLTPPDAKASPQVRQAYAEVVEQIQQDRDPLKSVIGTSPEELERLNKRRAMAKQQRLQNQKKGEERAKKNEAKFAELKKHHDEVFGVRPPQPQFDTDLNASPKLGAPYIPADPNAGTPGPKAGKP